MWIELHRPGRQQRSFSGHRLLLALDPALVQCPRRRGPRPRDTRFGIALLIVAWVLLGWMVRVQTVRTRTVVLLGLLWLGPLLLAPPMLSDDAYAYVASGALQADGFDPYLVGPRALGAGVRVVQTVAPTWRRNPAPYGPGFLLITRGLAALTGAHVIVTLVLVRAVAILSVWSAALWGVPAGAGAPCPGTGGAVAARGQPTGDTDPGERSAQRRDGHGVGRRCVPPASARE